MSIYFQYPAIDEYPSLIYPLRPDVEKSETKDEDKLSKEQILELRDYLTLKQL
ncbi:hypothetical protein [uncultured Pedobacter sp.]|uniref:hypothetical protein n=1 Tax=uncultured Pedobacter sp. TaxID=246139 RepID=UPI0025CEDD31|nr:hypothetical protein [uncultured Pedobacter sp.]